jgi:hypothetical protein
VRVTVIATGFGGGGRRRRRREAAPVQVPGGGAGGDQASSGFEMPPDVLDVPSFLRDE